MTRVPGQEITQTQTAMQENVLTARLTAFASLGVVAGLMVQNSLDPSQHNCAATP